jgi:serine/threonine protein kinase
MTHRRLQPYVGQTIAKHYRIEQILASGGMGLVVEAVHVKLGKRVAIKLLRPDVPCRRTAVRRFLRETRIASQLRSKHIVQMYAAGELQRGEPFLVMELLEGEDLGERLEWEGSLAARDAVDLVLQAARGVAAAHARNIVHRDIKPENLFVTREADGSEVVKVLDFGLSKVRQRIDSDAEAEALSAELTGPTTKLGTCPYMPPEQWMCSRDVDARGDVWALGVVLFELISGERPFDARGIGALMHKILNGERQQLSELVAGVPAALDAIIDRCIAVNPDDRFADASELVEALEAVVGIIPEQVIQRRSPMSQRAALRTQPVMAAAAALLIASTTWSSERNTTESALADTLVPPTMSSATL